MIGFATTRRWITRAASAWSCSSARSRWPPGWRPTSSTTVRAGHPLDQPGAAGRHQPGRDRRGGQEGRGGARRARDDVETYQVTVGRRRLQPVRRRRRRQQRRVQRRRSTRTPTPTTVTRRAARASSTSSTGVGEITVGGGGGAGFGGRPARGRRAGRRPGGAGHGDRAGARRRWPARRTSTDVTSSLAASVAARRRHRRPRGGRPGRPHRGGRSARSVAQAFRRRPVGQITRRRRAARTW